MFGIVPKVLWERQKKADDRNRVTMDMNCLLIRDADNVVVVETGAGPKLTERQKEIFGIQDPPRLLDELKTLGVRPADVTLVINTHLHFDHSGGNTYRDDGRIVPTFPRASYVFQRREWADAIAPNERSRGSYLPDDYAPLEAAGKLELIDESVEILPGVRLDRVQGHTRGTQTVRITDRDTTLFFSSDFMPDRHHLPLPWIPAFDLFPLDTLAAKKLILRRAIDERWIVGFTHDLPRFGRISASRCPSTSACALRSAWWIVSRSRSSFPGSARTMSSVAGSARATGTATRSRRSPDSQPRRSWAARCSARASLSIRFSAKAIASPAYVPRVATFAQSACSSPPAAGPPRSPRPLRCRSRSGHTAARSCSQVRFPSSRAFP